jgi:hypothetical protein
MAVRPADNGGNDDPSLSEAEALNAFAMTASQPTEAAPKRSSHGTSAMDHPGGRGGGGTRAVTLHPATELRLLLILATAATMVPVRRLLWGDLPREVAAAAHRPRRGGSALGCK